MSADMELPYNPKKEEEELNVGSVVTVDVSSTSFFLEDLLETFLEEALLDIADFFTDVGFFVCLLLLPLLLSLLFPLSPLLALLNVSTLTVSLLIVVMDAEGILDILDLLLLVLDIIKSDGNSTIRRMFFIFCCCCFAMFDIDVLLSNVVSFVFVVELPNEFLRT